MSSLNKWANLDVIAVASHYVHPHDLKKAFAVDRKYQSGLFKCDGCKELSNAPDWSISCTACHFDLCEGCDMKYRSWVK
jgi:flavoprotein